jgi:hypothetical protein
MLNFFNVMKQTKMQIIDGDWESLDKEERCKSVGRKISVCQLEEMKPLSA